MVDKLTYFSAPKKTPGSVDKDHMRDNGQQCTTKEGSEDQSSQKTTDNNKNNPAKISGGLDPEIAKKSSVSQTSADEMKPAGGEMCHLIKKEKEEIKVSITRSPSGEVPGSIKVEKGDEAQAGKEGNTMYNCIPTHDTSYPCKGNNRKRANSISEKSQHEKESDEKIEMACKRRRSTSEQSVSPEQSHKLPSGLKEASTTDTGGSCTSSHKTIKDEGTFICRELLRVADRLMSLSLS